MCYKDKVVGCTNANSPALCNSLARCASALCCVFINRMGRQCAYWRAVNGLIPLRQSDNRVTRDVRLAQV